MVVRITATKNRPVYVCALTGGGPSDPAGYSATARVLHHVLQRAGPIVHLGDHERSSPCRWLDQSEVDGEWV
jgi:hypothetical protein